MISGMMAIEYDFRKLRCPNSDLHYNILIDGSLGFYRTSDGLRIGA